MSQFIAKDETPIESVQELVLRQEQSVKEPTHKFIGLEHEKFLYHKDNFDMVAYEYANSDRKGIVDILTQLNSYDNNWELKFENGKPSSALNSNAGSITLEPGGQFEFSSTMQKNLFDTKKQLDSHKEILTKVCDDFNIGISAMGFVPQVKLESMPKIPLKRYKFLTKKMEMPDKQGHLMMYQTSTHQISFDYFSEKDMRKKFLTSLVFQPLASLLSATSPFANGKDSGYLSLRAKIWNDIVMDRTGLPKCVFNENFGFEEWIDYVVNLKIFLLNHKGRHIETSGNSFKDFLDGKLETLRGVKPSFSDWNVHLTTVFTEVRLKNFLELRGLDSGPIDNIMAMTAFWTGIFYSQPAIDAAYDLAKQVKYEDAVSYRQDILKNGFATKIKLNNKLVSILDVIQDLASIAKIGLKSRNVLNPGNDKHQISEKAKSDEMVDKNTEMKDESIFLEPLLEIISKEKTFSHTLLEKFRTEWHQDANKALLETKL